MSSGKYGLRFADLFSQAFNGAFHQASNARERREAEEKDRVERAPQRKFDNQLRRESADQSRQSFLSNQNDRLADNYRQREQYKTALRTKERDEYGDIMKGSPEAQAQVMDIYSLGSERDPGMRESMQALAKHVHEQQKQAAMAKELREHQQKMDVARVQGQYGVARATQPIIIQNQQETNRARSNKVWETTTPENRTSNDPALQGVQAIPPLPTKAGPQASTRETAGEKELVDRVGQVYTNEGLVMMGPEAQQQAVDNLRTQLTPPDPQKLETMRGFFRTAQSEEEAVAVANAWAATRKISARQAAKELE
jgi:hypothetical protein